jgi:hypothetical protein
LVNFFILQVYTKETWFVSVSKKTYKGATFVFVLHVLPLQYNKS